VHIAANANYRVALLFIPNKPLLPWLVTHDFVSLSLQDMKINVRLPNCRFHKVIENKIKQFTGPDLDLDQSNKQAH